jgi:hypothetical protein
VNEPTHMDLDFRGEDALRSVVGSLVSDSCEFKVTPLPDDVWRVTVKIEHAPRLRRHAVTLEKTMAAAERLRLDLVAFAMQEGAVNEQRLNLKTPRTVLAEFDGGMRKET